MLYWLSRIFRLGLAAVIERFFSSLFRRVCALHSKVRRLTNIAAATALESVYDNTTMETLATGSRVGRFPSMKPAAPESAARRTLLESMRSRRGSPVRGQRFTSHCDGNLARPAASYPVGLAYISYVPPVRYDESYQYNTYPSRTRWACA
jgi:hypothetical protein